MSEVKVNKISPRTNCGTVTLGDSGDTFTIPSGVTITNNGTQTGFGRTGTVDWQTGSIKTTTFTAANGEGYFADTSSGAFTMNLPAGTAGNIVSVVDYTNTFQTHTLTITPNGSQKIGGIAQNARLTSEGQSVTFVYVDDTEGWKNVQDSTSNVTGNPFVVASGGTESTCGNCKIHTFTGPGTFTVSQVAQCAANNVVSYLVVAGGGAAGTPSGSGGSGGGGAGGFREVKSPVTPYTASPLDGYPSAPNRVTLTAQGYPIQVGGGAPVTQPGPVAGADGAGVSGTPSIFSTITSAGGGGGGGKDDSSSGENGVAGGSGGGARYGPFPSGGGAGNTPPTTPSQGNDGGDTPSQTRSASGGGGAGAVGSNGAPGSGYPTGSQPGADGGAGVTTSINGTPTAYAGGGGGGKYAGSEGSGGTGGGGDSGNPGVNGTANTGGGGGGGSAPATGTGGAGGSGIVVIRYKFQ
tara:strand:- start:16 stop:1410 length:1395 start_codon:yes stop_codon:yes gene_type:complete